MSPIPKHWQTRLSRGARARLRGTLNFDQSAIPLDLVVRVEIEDGERLALGVTLPLSEDRGDSAVAQLTPRERKVVRLIGMGKETDEIAGLLFIAPNTVRTHVRNAMSKLGAHTRAELVARVFADPHGPMSHPGDEEGGESAA